MPTTRPPSPLNSMEEKRLELTLAQLDRLAGFYPRVEGKASFLLAINLGLISLVLLNSTLSPFFSAANGPLLIFATLISLSIFDLISTFIPHLKGGMRTSKLYFGEISQIDCARFISEWRSMTDEDLLVDGSIQIWRNAEILGKKFRACDRAFKLTFLAMPLWLYVMLLAAAGSTGIRLS